MEDLLGQGWGVGEWLRTTGFLIWITRKPVMGDVEDGAGDGGDMLVLWPFEHLQPLRDSSDCLMSEEATEQLFTGAISSSPKGSAIKY